MSQAALDALRARIYDDVEVAQRLRRIAPDLFVPEVMRVAAESGHDVAVDDIQRAIAQGRTAWSLRWIR